MDSWNGNNIVFKTYAPGRAGEKAPAVSVKWKDHILDFPEASQKEDFGGIMQDGYIDISFDDAEMGEAFLKMAKANKWRCLVLQNPMNKHIHTYLKNEQGRIKTMSAKDQKLSVGFIADIHGGCTYIPLRVNGVDRFPPIYDYRGEEGDYQELPEELIPVNTKVKLWGQGEGGRNNALSGMARYLVHNTFFSKNAIRRILTNTNDFVFADRLPDSEVDTILRDETFEGITEIPELNTLNGAELSTMDIKPVEFVIEGLIPIGLTLLASPPKYGKSWLCLDMGISVASGKKFLGFTTKKSGVLYMSLEDRFDRLKQRMNQILDSGHAPMALELAIDSAVLGKGFIEQMEGFLNEHPETKLIIIDTFVKIRGEAKRNESAYAADSREAGTIKKFADSHGVAVVLVAHTRKGIDPDDPFVNITGTYGVAGAADDMIVLTKQKRGDEVTKMSVTGRDVFYEEYALVFEKDRGKWMRQSEAYDDFLRRSEHEVKYI